MTDAAQCVLDHRLVNDSCVMLTGDYNNNNNNHDNVYGAVIVAQSHCESSPGSYD